MSSLLSGGSSPSPKKQKQKLQEQQQQQELSRRTEQINLLTDGVGIQPFIKMHQYGPDNDDCELIYIQGSLHADELPGIMVNHHLLRLLDITDKIGSSSRGGNHILKRIHIVPYANPFGLNQTILHDVQGRFNIATGTNFNRNFANTTKNLIKNGIYDKLKTANSNSNSNNSNGNSNNNSNSNSDSDNNYDEIAKFNTEIVRQEIIIELNNLMNNTGITSEEHYKLQLLIRACKANIVLDLHCDSHALMHMYTHTALWTDTNTDTDTDHCIMKTLACELQASPVQLATLDSACCFDDICSGVYYELHNHASNTGDDKKPILMGCASATVELRGELDVSDETAFNDACAIYRFLQRQGYIASGVGVGVGAGTDEVVVTDNVKGNEFHALKVLEMLSTNIRSVSLPSLPREAASLEATDMIKATAGGIINWNCELGDEVKTGDILGEIINVEVRESPFPFLSFHCIPLYCIAVYCIALLPLLLLLLLNSSQC